MKELKRSLTYLKDHLIGNRGYVNEVLRINIHVRECYDVMVSIDGENQSISRDTSYDMLMRSLIF